MDRRCETCRHAEIDSDPREGECRKSPPRIVGYERNDPLTVFGAWPRVQTQYDWCSEHSPRHLSDEEAGC